MTHPCCSVNQYFIPSYGWVKPHCVAGPPFVYPVINWVTYRLFPLCGLLWVMLFWIFVHEFLSVCCFQFSQVYPRTRIAKSYGHCVYLFEELQNCFPRSDTPFNTFTSSVCSFQLLNILLTLNNTHVFYSTLSGCEMASLGGFDLDFPRLIVLIFSYTISHL